MTSDTHELSAPLARLAEVLRPLAGQRIALIAPAGGVKNERIDIMLTVLEAAGIDAKLGAHARDHHRYLAGTAEARLADLHWAFELPDVAAVWCLRGGYGSAHLVDHIDWSRIPRDIPLIGFSDITVLLEAFRQHGRAGIHGPVATQLAMPGDTAEEQEQRAASIASLVDLLHGRATDWSLASTAAPTTGVAGQLVGGNLTTLASMVGTAAALRLETDSILLLEDVGEAEFRLERSFHQLIASLDEDRLRTVCLGVFEGCDLADGMSSLAGIIGEYTGARGIALYRGLAVGHGTVNHAWRYAGLARIADARLTFAG
ncbi:LD-carboxypeptidase [Salinisphaera sp. T31B1]|uniref:S66 peptidase family protein n=1 Tax=Salinisphaera sp. T31B1 TaxID=727963 RepID=UPI00333EC22B